MRGTIAVVLMMLGSLPGCVFGLNGWGDEPATSGSAPDDYYGYGESELQVSNPEMAGELGSVRFAGQADVQNAYGYPGYAYIEMHNTQRNWGMNGITFEGGIDTLEAGQHFEFNGYNDYSGEATVFVSVLGCSGPAQGNFEYDTSAERVVVDVSEGELENTVRVDYTAWFPNYQGGDDHIVRGTVTVN